MKKFKIVFYLLLVAAVISCEKKHKTQKIEKTINNSYEVKYLESNLIQVEFDGCEYVMYYHERTITHKGNCKNKVHDVSCN